MSDLNAVFGSSGSVSKQDGDAIGLATNVRGIGQGSVLGTGNQSLLDMDQTVVSTTGDAMFQAMGTSDARADKVASLQAAIAGGTYQVSSSDVAGKLIDSMLGKG